MKAVCKPHNLQHMFKRLQTSVYLTKFLSTARLAQLFLLPKHCN
jgi:hypothetical protein